MLKHPLLGFFVSAFLALGLVGSLTVAAYMSAPTPPKPQEAVGWLDTTDLGYINIHYYEIHTPDGSVPCLVTEPDGATGQGYHAAPALDCDWTVIR